MDVNTGTLIAVNALSQLKIYSSQVSCNLGDCRKMSSKKVQAAARFDLMPPHAIPQDSTPVLPDTSYAATIN